MDAVDNNATPEHAATITFFRQLNAVLGVILAPLLFVVIMSWAVLTWFRSGRDPIYLDDPSIHIPAPPPGLTPAAGATVRDGQVSRRALTAASLDLAVRGLISFEAEDKQGLLASGQEIGIHTSETVTRRPEGAGPHRCGPAGGRWTRARTSCSGTSSRSAAARTTSSRRRSSSSARTSRASRGASRTTASRRAGSRSGRPSRRAAGAAAAGSLFIVGILAVILGANLPSSGIALVGAALVATGRRPVRHRRRHAVGDPRGLDDPGDARGLQADAREDDGAGALDGQVVSASAIPLIESPDDAVAWGVALGLQDEVQRVLERTAEDRAGQGTRGYVPHWYGAQGNAYWSGGNSGGGGVAPGLMSSSPIPNFGGMMAALGTIGNSPASSGSGWSGGGGFSGGSSGGGGGGSGGGF